MTEFKLLALSEYLVKPVEKKIKVQNQKSLQY